MSYGTQPANQLAETRTTEVRTELNSMGEEFKILFERMEAIESRLKPITAERSEPSGSEPKNPEPVRVELANEIHIFVTETARVNARLASLMNRLEL